MKLLKTTALAAATIVLAAGSATDAFASSSTRSSAISGAERRNKVHRVIDVLENAYKACDKTINEQFGDGSSGSTMPYSNGADKLKKMAQTLRRMLDTNRLREGNITSRARTCTSRGGTEGDRVIIPTRTIDAMCGNAPGGGSVSDACAAANYFYLGASLANELVHVYENPPSGETGDPRGCDVERDSDCASLKFICAIIDTLTDSDGNAHDDPDDVLTDPEYVALVWSTLGDTGVNTQAEMEALVEKLKQRKESYKDRKENLFERAITFGVDWGPIYYAGWDGTPVAPRRKDEDGRQFTEVTNFAGDSQQFPVPPNTLLVESRTLFDDFQHVVLVQLSVDQNSGQGVVQFFRDNDGDFLPEPLPAAPDQFLPQPLDPFTPLEGVAIQPELPPQLHPLELPNGLMFVDTLQGTIQTLPLGPDMLPVPPGPQFLHQDPLLVAGNFPFLHGDILVGDELRLIFTNNAAETDMGEVPAIYVGVDLLTGIPFTFAPPGLTVAEANAPANPIGLQDSQVGLFDPVLIGNPGDTVEIRSIGHGSVVPLGSAVIDQDGEEQVPLSDPLQAGLHDVILPSSPPQSAGEAYVFYEPRTGEATDCEPTPDATGDGLDDRLDLSVDPPRLHLSDGVASSDPNVVDFRWEMVLPIPEPGHLIEPWNDVDGRAVSDLTSEVPIEIVELELVSCQPITVTYTGQPMLWDLEVALDNGADDRFSLHRTQGSSEWQGIVIPDTSLPGPYQCVPLPPIPEDFFDPGSDPFIPRIWSVEDVDLDGSLDIRIPDFNTNPDLCYINQSDGTFVLIPCEDAVGCDGDANGDGLVDVNDISFVIFRLGDSGAPCIEGDANGDGVVDVNDISYVIFRLGTCNPGGPC